MRERGEGVGLVRDRIAQKPCFPLPEGAAVVSADSHLPLPSKLNASAISRRTAAPSFCFDIKRRKAAAEQSRLVIVIAWLIVPFPRGSAELTDSHNRDARNLGSRRAQAGFVQRHTSPRGQSLRLLVSDAADT